MAAVFLTATSISTPASDVLEEVIVVAKRRTPLQAAPDTITVIDQQQITRTVSNDIRELVRYEPGVSVRNDAVRFGLDSFAIRGIGGDRIAIDVDGVAAAESFTVGALADSGRVFTDLAFLDHVEIVRGPASALYGSDAIGGVVHFQTVDPEDVLSSGATFAARARTGYRSATEGWSAALLNAWSTANTQWLLGYVHRDDHEADIAGALEPDPRHTRADQVLAKLVLPGDAPIEIAAEVGRTRDSTTVNALLGVPPRFTNTTSMLGDDVAEHARVAIEQRLQPDNAWMDEATWRVHGQVTNTEQVTEETRRAAPPRTPPAQLQRKFTLEDHSLGLEMTAAKSLGTRAWTHDIVYGLELDVGRVTELRDGVEVNLNSGVVNNVILGERFPVRDFPITERTEAGLYVQNEIRTQGKWRFTPGVRFDYYRLQPKEDAIYREDNPSSRPVSLHEQALTPKLAAAYELTASTTAFAQYARGFRSPPFEDVNIGLEMPTLNYRAIPNPDLRPETSDAFELGVRTHNAAWRTTLSLNYTDFDDFIESRVNLGRDPATGTTLFQSRNLERAYMYGAEFSSRLAAGELFESLQGWSVGLNGALARGDNLTTHQPLNAVEPLKATLMVGYEAPRRWGGSLAFTGAAAKDRVDDANTVLYRTGSYLVLDAFAHVALGERGELNLALTNLTNERYIDWIDVRGRAVDDPLIPYSTHPGRAASLTLSWSF